MITLGLTGLVLSILFSIFLVSNRTYKKTIEQGENQRNIRLVSDFITRELRSAGEISSDEAALRNGGTIYYSLGLALHSNTRLLIRSTFENSKPVETITIGDSLSELKFMPSNKAGMIRIRIGDNEDGEEYVTELEFRLENMSYISLPSEGVERIFYTRYE